MAYSGGVERAEDPPISVHAVRGGGSMDQPWHGSLGTGKCKN